MEGNNLQACTGNTDDMHSVLLTVVWKHDEQYLLQVSKYTTVLSIKLLLEEITLVDKECQKLLGLVKGRLPDNHETLESLGIISNTRIRLIGTRKADQLRSTKSKWDEPDCHLPAISDTDSTDTGTPVVVSNYRKRLDKVISRVELQVINPPRPGRKLLVLDLDYTLLDCNPGSGDMVNMARPGLDQFLTAAYRHYDLIVWSQTSWMVLESKMTILGMLTHPNYRIVSALNSSMMISVRSQRGGKVVSHHVKALEIIWSWFSQYNYKNTVHVDDLDRNFVLNWQSGLRIRPYKRNSLRAYRDRELEKLAQYLLLIAELDTFEHLDHSQWKGLVG
ncbi:HAD-like domain-containing protein [Coemansia mojavensis]|nr:HAD-like domain-containing protein [Coemansia mojavensis]